MQTNTEVMDLLKDMQKSIKGMQTGISRVTPGNVSHYRGQIAMSCIYNLVCIKDIKKLLKRRTN